MVTICYRIILQPFALSVKAHLPFCRFFIDSDGGFVSIFNRKAPKLRKNYPGIWHIFY